MKNLSLNRRAFLRHTFALTAGAPLALRSVSSQLFAADASTAAVAGGLKSAARRSDSKVAIVSCKGYGPEARESLDKCFDLVGGIGSLVKNKTVTVKLNLTGTNFAPVQFDGDDRKYPVGDTYMTHFSTAMALGRALFANGAKRVRFVESTQSRATLASTLAMAEWDVKALESLGKMEFENTRNLGDGKNYSHLKVPTGGLMFSNLDLNHSYEDTDVMVSIAKLKNHITAGVTLSMKNLFGITPNSLYGSQAGDEDAIDGRGPLHNPTGFEKIKLPGLKDGIASTDSTWRVPRIVVDVCATRPIHLAIIDGITSMSGGEGPWCKNAATLKPTTPGVMIVGLNPVSTDAVGTAVMGYDNPRAVRGVKPFHFCDNHLLMAEEAGLGSADLSQIDVRGLSIEKAKYPYG
jgi:uncharacterized protein (DUF362 family)